MEKTKAIKGVSDNAWATFKALAAKKKKPLKVMFEELVFEKEKSKEGLKDEWESMLKIAKKEPGFTNKELLEVKNKMRTFRKSFTLSR